MSVQLLLAKPAGGKTTFCVNEINKIRKNDPMASVKVIVPDRMQMAYWKQTLSRASFSIHGSGFIGTEVISFSKLAMEILDRAGNAPLLIPSRLERLCIQDAIRRTSAETPLRYFEPIRDNPGLPGLFERTIHALLHGCVTPKQLETLVEQHTESVREGSVTSVPDSGHIEPGPGPRANDRPAVPGLDVDKITDTTRVYRKYLEILKDNNWISSTQLLSTAADILFQNQTAYAHFPLLIADGFNELNQDAINLLKALIPCCDEILLTLPANPDSDHPTDQRIMENAKRIRADLNSEFIFPEKQNTPVSGSIWPRTGTLVPDTSLTKKSIPVNGILQLSDHIFSNTVHTDDLIGKTVLGFLMIEASSRTTEVREALRELKRQILESRNHPGSELFPNECAIFVPDMQAYAPIFRQFGREMGIPLRFSQKQSLSESPAASALKRLLRLYPDYATLEMMSVLRLPFLSGCPDPNDSYGNYSRDLYVLDQIARKMNIISGTAEWPSAFALAINEAPEKTDSDREEIEEIDEGKAYDYPERSKLERIQISFDKFIGYLTPLEGKHSRAEWIKWLDTLLQTTRFYEQIEDRDGKSFEADFKAVLKRIVFCEEKLNQPAITYDEFLNELESEVNAAVQTEPEFVENRIFVGDIGQTSGCRWKLIVLTGFAEGVFPRAEHEELILSNSWKEKLGIRNAVDQQLLFHHAVTRSDTVLIITRPQKTDKGEEWPPSIYWLTIQNLLGSKEIRNANLKQVSESTSVIPASMEEFAFRLARGGGLNPGVVPESESGILREMLDNANTELSIMREQTAGKYSPEEDPELKAAISDPERDVKPYSCSAIENWLTCPFKYFLMKKLHLEQPKEPGTGLDAAQIGTLNHAVMEKTFSPGTVYDSKEEALERATKYFDIVFENPPDEFRFKEPELWRYEKEKYRQKLLETIEKMYSSPKNMPINAHWKSVGTELKFGYPVKGRENTEPFTVETEAGPIRIRGIIDRVDRQDGGLMRIVDYKTSLGSFTPEAMKAGAHIQAGIYAAAVVHALGMGKKCDGLYWGINDKSVKGFISYDSEKDETIPNIEYLNRFTAGIRDASFMAESAGGDCPDYCPAARWCRKYVRRQKYG